MKIVEVNTYRMAATPLMTGGTNRVFVRMETDSGIHGVGEGSLQYKEAGHHAAAR